MLTPNQSFSSTGCSTFLVLGDPDGDQKSDVVVAALREDPNTNTKTWRPLL